MNPNSEISQQEYISSQQQQRKKDVSSAVYEFNKKYEKYVQGEDDLLSSMIEFIAKKYRKTVIDTLRGYGCYDEDNEAEAMTESLAAVLDFLRNSRTEKKIDPSFIYKCKGIYSHKTIDVVRTVLSTKKKYGGDIHSLDEIDTNGSLIEDPVYKGKHLEDLMDDGAKKRSFYDYAFEMYCKALTEIDAEPPKCLALYYARVLPHVLQIYFGINTIADSKAASPKWALEKMGKRTVEALSTESETQMQSYVSKKLMWCDAFQNQLNESVTTSNGKQIMKCIILADQYDEKQLGHVTDYMHKKVAENWVRLMKENREMTETAVRYTADLDKISKLLEGESRR